MTLNEKISYIRGLAEGLKLDENKDEVKVITAIVDLLDDMALAVTDMEDLYDEMSEQLDEIDEDLAELEDVFYDEDDNCCDCDCGDEDKYGFADDEAYYEVTCGKCGEEICVSEDILLCGEIECPKCGELLEFDFSDLECENDCDCDCCCSHDDEK